MHRTHIYTQYSRKQRIDLDTHTLSPEVVQAFNSVIMFDTNVKCEDWKVAGFPEDTAYISPIITGGAVGSWRGIVVARSREDAITVAEYLAEQLAIMHTPREQNQTPNETNNNEHEG